VRTCYSTRTKLIEFERENLHRSMIWAYIGMVYWRCKHPVLQNCRKNATFVTNTATILLTRRTPTDGRVLAGIEFTHQANRNQRNNILPDAIILARE